MKQRLRMGFLVFVLGCIGTSNLCRASEYRVVLHKNKDLPITTFNIVFRVGSADDPKDKYGVGELTTALLREGGVTGYKNLPARTRAEIEEVLYPMAAEIGASTHEEQVSFRVTSTEQDAEKVFDVLTQMILAPAFDAHEFERLRSENLDALQKQLPREDQEELGKAALDQWIYGFKTKSHPYAHVIDGTVHSLKSLKLDDVKKFYSTYFTQKRLTVGVAGVVSPSLENKIKTVFRALPVGQTTKAEIPEPTQSVPGEKSSRLLIVKGPFEATGVHLGHPLSVNRKNPDFAYLYLASQAFGKHRSFVGRLMHDVREVRGLNYGTYSYVENFPEGGARLAEPTQAARTRQAFTVWARPTTLENGCFLLRQVYREIELFVEKGLKADEFKLVQSHVIGNAPLQATGIERQLGYSLDSVFYGISGDYLRSLQTKLKQAKLAQVNATIQKYLRPDQLKIVVVTKDPEKFKSEVLSPKCGIRYAEGIEKPSDILAEDQAISAYSLNLKPNEIEIIESDELFVQ